MLLHEENGAAHAIVAPRRTGGGMGLGVAALAAALLLELETVWRIALFVIAAIGFLTAASRYCPLNSIIGRNSCRKT